MVMLKFRNSGNAKEMFSAMVSRSGYAAFKYRHPLEHGLSTRAHSGGLGVFKTSWYVMDLDGRGKTTLVAGILSNLKNIYRYYRGIHGYPLWDSVFDANNYYK